MAQKKIREPFFSQIQKFRKTKMCKKNCFYRSFFGKIVFNMVFKVSTEQRIFNTLEFTKKKGTIENLNNFSLKTRPERKIANFLIPILQSFCDSLIQSLKNFKLRYK